MQKKSVLTKLVTVKSRLCWRHPVLAAFWRKEQVSAKAQVQPCERSPVPLRGVLLRRMLAFDSRVCTLMANRNLVIQESLNCNRFLLPVSR